MHGFHKMPKNLPRIPRTIFQDLYNKTPLHMTADWAGQTGDALFIMSSCQSSPPRNSPSLHVWALHEHRAVSTKLCSHRGVQYAGIALPGKWYSVNFFTRWMTASPSPAGPTALASIIVKYWRAALERGATCSYHSQ